MNELFQFSGQPELQSPTLIVGWSTDASQLGTRVTDYLNRKLGGQAFCEIEPVEFFSLGGVTIENDLVQFPESKFYACPENDLVIFQSTTPSHEWHKFLNLILDIAQNHCHVKELYTVGGMITLGAHTAPRDMWSTFNSPELKRTLSPYRLSREMNFETPPGGRPTLNSFLLWTAQRRSIPGANLWVPIPFYLVAADVPRAQRRVLEFLNHRLDLQIDFADLDEETRKQDEQMDRMRAEFPEIDKFIGKLESNIRLSDEENEKLVKQVEQFLRETEE